MTPDIEDDADELSPDKSVRKCMDIIRARVAELQNRTGAVHAVATKARDATEDGGHANRNQVEYLWDAAVELAKLSKDCSDELGAALDTFFVRWEVAAAPSTSEVPHLLVSVPRVND